MKTYIGDGVYVEDEGTQFKLYTEDGAGNVRNVIYLENSAVTSFLKFVEKTRDVTISVDRTK
jgi:hypothetical protein